jgi:nucleoside-triphosphatase
MPMRLQHPKTLLTGKPGVGKTTLVRRIVERIHTVPMAGFYTSEIRSKGYRSGFELVGLNGGRRVLAHVDRHSRQRVGKYGVDTAGFEAFLEDQNLLNAHAALIVIDEIGKMELFSKRFRSLIETILDSDKMMLATIALHGKGLIQQIKRRRDTHLFEVTPSNRDSLISAVLD